MAKYVKFMRGTPTAYDNLRTKEADTLYFISETDAVRNSGRPVIMAEDLKESE